MKARPFTLIALLLFATSICRAQTQITETFANNNKTKTLEDLILKFPGVNVNSVDNIDGFKGSAFKNIQSGGYVALTGGMIPPQSDVMSLKITLAQLPPVTLYQKYSFTDGSQYSQSAGDDIFSTAIFGGSSGTNFAGVSIPAHQYGYFYQFDRNSLFTQSPDAFAIAVGGAPTSSGVLLNTWSVSLLSSDFPSSSPALLDDHMTPENLTGTPGISPASWSFSDGQMLATYSTTFGIGDVASVLWYTSPLAPELGGPLGVGGNNASLSAGGQVLFTNGVLSSVPEPSSLMLLTIGTLGFIGYAGHRRKRTAA